MNVIILQKDKSYYNDFEEYNTIEEELALITQSINNEPKTYKEAINSPNKDNWQNAI